MMTTETSSKIKDTTHAYLDRLEQGHERFAAAIAATRERSARVTEKFIDGVLAGQRDALALGKTVISEPTAVGKNMETFLQSLSAAQERALDLAKAVYHVNTEITCNLRDAATRVIEANKKFGAPFEKLAQVWTPAAK